MARRSTSRDVSSTKENNGTPDSSPQEDRRGALLQRMGALLQRKTHVSTRRIGHADDADCTGSYLRLDRLAPFWRGVWIPIQFICASSHRQPRSARPGLTWEPPYAGYGSRDEEPRHQPSTDATAGENLQVKAMCRALTKRVNYHGSKYFRFGNGHFEQGKKRQKRKPLEAQAHPLPVCIPTSRLCYVRDHPPMSRAKLIGIVSDFSSPSNLWVRVY
jgi:hypothetical protein